MLRTAKAALPAVIAILAGILLTDWGVARAQQLVYTFTTENAQAQDACGTAVATGDVDGDGHADVAIACPFETVSGNAYQGRVYVFSGATGAPLWTLTTPSSQANAYFGSGLAIADVNGDGKADIAVLASSAVYIFSGGNGALLRTVPRGGDSIALGFVRGVAGQADLVLGDSFETVAGLARQGRVYVYSGADGASLYTLTTPNPQMDARFGNAVAVGDINGDGKADVVVGAWLETVGSNTAQGRAYTFSGADGSLLYSLTTGGPQPNAYFGSSVAVGDVNGDGKADIAVGSPNEWVNFGVEQGRAYVFSGATGSAIYALRSPNPQAGGFGYAIAVGDVNRDGRADVVVGAQNETVAGNGFQGRAYVFSGANGSALDTLNTPNPQSDAYFGNAVAVGDVNGDGTGDLVVAANGEVVGGQDHQGRVYVFASAPAVVPISVGGVSDVELRGAPDGASSGRGSVRATALIVGVVTAATLILIGAGRLYLRRKRAA